MKNKMYGPLMLDLEGLAISQIERETLSSAVVGGLILFSRNFKSLEQLEDLVTQIRAISPDILIAVDHEGGRVQRFRNGFTRLPPMSVLGSLYQARPDEGLSFARDVGWLMAAELVSFDIDISFAPVLDIDFGVSQVIGDRAFSSVPSEIILLTRQFIAGMREAGMASTGKHFPGHGFVSADSHTETPIDTRSYEEIGSSDLAVFKALCESGMDAVMPAHVIYPNVCDMPAGFSHKWLQDILRNQLKFDGVIFSDDLGMEGASVAGDFKARTDAGLKAGCDMILVCNNPEAGQEVKKYLEAIDAQANERLARMRLDKRKRMSWDELRQTSRWKDTHKQILALQEDINNNENQVGE